MEYIEILGNPNFKLTEKKCDKSELVYDTSVVESSVVSEYGLTCDDHYLRSLVGSTYMLGMLFGSIIFGIVSDRFGRITALICAVVTMTTSAVVRGNDS